MGTLAVPLLIAGTAMQAVGSIAQGHEQNRQAKFQADQAKIREEETRIAATQAEAARRQEFNDSMENVAAIRAGRGVSADSPTFSAFLTDARNQHATDIQTERYNYLSRADSLSMSAENSRRAGRISLLSGYLNAGMAIGQGAHRLGSHSSGSAPSSGGSRLQKGPHGTIMGLY